MTLAFKLSLSRQIPRVRNHQNARTIYLNSCLISTATVDSAGLPSGDDPPPALRSPKKAAGDGATDQPAVCGVGNNRRCGDDCSPAAGEASGVLVTGAPTTDEAANWKWAGRGRWAGLAEGRADPLRWSKCRLNSCGVEELELLFLYYLEPHLF